MKDTDVRKEGKIVTNMDCCKNKANQLLQKIFGEEFDMDHAQIFNPPQKYVEGELRSFRLVKRWINEIFGVSFSKQEENLTPGFSWI